MRKVKIIAISLFISLVCMSFYSSIHAKENEKLLSSKEIRGNIFGSSLITEKEIIAVGDSGKIYLSVDSGKKWQIVRSGTSEQLFSVSFSNSKNGWIAGSSGLILHTSDGGRTWIQQKTGIDKHLFGIHFFDSLHGCAVGDWGAIVVTDDGGKRWKDVHLPEDVVLYAVRLTKSGGIIVGEFGSVFRSNNQGQTWTKGPPVSDQKVMEVPLGIQLFWFGTVNIYPAGDSITGFGMGAHGISFGLKDKEIAW